MLLMSFGLHVDLDVYGSRGRVMSYGSGGRIVSSRRRADSAVTKDTKAIQSGRTLGEE